MKKTRRTHAEITVANQIVCAEYYANARNCAPRGGFIERMDTNPVGKNERRALYWQRGAENHFIKTTYRMGFLDAMLAGCAYWQDRTKYG